MAANPIKLPAGEWWGGGMNMSVCHSSLLLLHHFHHTLKYNALLWSALHYMIFKNAITNGNGKFITLSALANCHNDHLHFFFFKIATTKKNSQRQRTALKIQVWKRKVCRKVAFCSPLIVFAPVDRWFCPGVPCSLLKLNRCLICPPPNIASNYLPLYPISQ